jgi:phosphopantothenate-cysteine ligase
LHLRNVPKVLGKITSDWAPKVFVISFKVQTYLCFHLRPSDVFFKQLETDEQILEHKVKQSLSNYRQELVVANMLQSYKTKVMLYAKDGSVQTVLKEGPSDIEEKLILAICEKHGKFLEEQESK